MQDKLGSSDSLTKFGQLMLDSNDEGYNIQLLSIIGEIEGHDTA